jgi:hypothetical protein
VVDLAAGTGVVAAGAGRRGRGLAPAGGPGARRFPAPAGNRRGRAGREFDRQQGALRVYTEGGNLNTDGVGGVLYSERTYTRNPGVPRAAIDERIASAFNATRAIVLQAPVLDATGHVDMFSKIVGESTVLVGRSDPDEVDHARLEANAAALAAATNGAGVPWPPTPRCSRARHWCR